MDMRIKNWVGLVGMFALMVFALSSLMYVRTYGKSIEPTSFRSFSVSGEGKAVMVPDVARFTFDVITEGGTNLANLQTSNTQKANAIIAFLKEQGVDTKDIRTENYNVRPRYQHFDCSPSPFIYSGDGVVSSGAAPSGARSCPPPEIVGYTVQQTVSVKARDFSKVGGLLSGVVENGANSVSQLSFTVDDPTNIENEARAEAIVKAKEKAEAVAEAGGFRIGRLLSINEGGVSPFFNRQYLESYAADAVVGAPAPSIEPGSQDFAVSVTLTYEIR